MGVQLSPLSKYFEEVKQPTSSTIETVDISNFTMANDVVDKYMPGWSFELPDYDDPTVHYLVGISGGVDSSALAAALAAKHQVAIRDRRMTFLFTDTGNEPKSCEDILDRLEELFGIEVVRLNEETLAGVIEENGGFLPSARSRWCTKRLKIDPWEKFLKEQFLSKGKRIIGFSGVRYDERERAGVFGVEGVTSSFPFVDQRVERAAVCSVASILGLMNAAYLQGRSRSGCQWCFFMSKQELVSLNVWSPKSFEEGMSKEKVADHVLERLTSDRLKTPARGYYAQFPFSKLITSGKSSFLQTDVFGNENRMDKVGTVNWDFRKTDKAPMKKRKAKAIHEDQIDMFAAALTVPESGTDDGKVEKPDESEIFEEEVTLYVGVECYKHETLSMFDNSYNGVWDQRLVTFSRTLGGLSRSLSGYHYHRQMASRSNFHDEDDYNNQSHLSVLAIKFPSGVIPRIAYGKDTYTWASGRSWAEVSHTIRAIERACEYAVHYKVIEQGKKGRIREDAEYFLEKYAEDGCPDLGNIVGIGHYLPKPISESFYDSYDEDISTVRCAICSI
ncbi:phosphoadenosine phosphosulfate reductase family protein [Vibrio sp. Makdt]|uniref:phosphoadenosine phosphosulfate reductase domain-containing protein n=1 Tax=Vibrio sp. Makdt TaxID=2998828 RepID=UPI0022CD6DD6|nr:phosphoadenosine phosphosulfate reductase family protein [Vibrio sp. Makdt]MDA0152281.1 phosphoadenosine phosphosulfate reductase family protein [Vibrio sp. Makdt]